MQKLLSKRLYQSAALKVKEEHEGYVVYEMALSDDSFVHFTPEKNVQEILEKMTLTSGEASVFAISTTYGQPASWINSYIGKKGEAVAAIHFKTSKKPKRGHAEEVSFDSPVPLTWAKALSKEGGLALLSGNKPLLEDNEWPGDYVVYS